MAIVLVARNIACVSSARLCRRSNGLLSQLCILSGNFFYRPLPPMGFYGKRKSVSRITSPDVVQKAFIVLWCLTIIWCEVGFFHLSLKDCGWPERRFRVSGEHFSHVLVVSDTQIKNPAIAPSWTSSFFTALEHLLFDLHLKKSWHFAMHFKPHHVIFLGDMTASGRRAVGDEECVPFSERRPRG